MKGVTDKTRTWAERAVPQRSPACFMQTKTCPPVFSVWMRYSTAVCFAWKVCPHDMTICSRKLTEHQRSLDPGDCFAGNQRHICRQTHHTLVSVWSRCTSSRALWFLKQPNTAIPSGAVLFLLQSLNILHYSTGNMKQHCICWRFVLCLKDKLNRLSSGGWVLVVWAPRLQLRHSRSWKGSRDTG